MKRIGIIGASGFTGVELLRLLAGSPAYELMFATGDSQAGAPLAQLYPSLAAHYGDRVFDRYDRSLVGDVDLIFLALPHGHSQRIAAELVDAGPHLVDLAADFRLQDASLYPAWYGEEHAFPELLPRFAYGLPELYRSQILASRHVAAPGCYVTSATVPLAPLLSAGLIEPTGIIVDAASGVSGAGRDKFPFCGTDEDFTAYGLLDHRHTPEIEQNLTVAAGHPAQVLFTPHLAPMNRGILATCYARPSGSVTTQGLLDCLHVAYGDEPYVVVSDRIPSTKATTGSNSIHLTARFDERTGTVIALAALDNLVKGASGQALQCANLLLGLPEHTGLTSVGTYP